MKCAPVPALPDTLRPFAALIAQAERNALTRGPLLIPIDRKRHVSTYDANRVIRQAVTATLDDPQAWRVEGCRMLLHTMQEMFTSPANKQTDKQ